MNRPPRTLVVRAVAYFAIRDLIPLYELYALLFRDHGVSASGISTLFIIWSVTSFVCEVPSGAWADVVSRRGLLVLSGFLYAAGFSAWTLVPSYAGFAAGFVLWGVSGALMSGTFEALLYDALAAHDATESYAGILGWANSASVVAQLVAATAATPLMALGGYALVGWASVAIALVQGAVALILPTAPRVAAAAEDLPRAPPARVRQRYVAILRAGVEEAARNVAVRRAVIVSALLLGMTAYDEYFSLVARENGVTTVQVPLAMTLVIAGQAVGTALAGRTARLGSRALGWLLGGAAVVLSISAFSPPPLGLVAMGLAYGAAGNVIVVSEARLQDSVTGAARATVTSVSGLLSEVWAVVLFAAVAGGSAWFDFRTMVAMLGLPLLGVAILARWWLPARRRAGAAEEGTRCERI